MFNVSYCARPLTILPDFLFSKISENISANAFPNRLALALSRTYSTYFATSPTLPTIFKQLGQFIPVAPVPAKNLNGAQCHCGFRHNCFFFEFFVTLVMEIQMTELGYVSSMCFIIFHTNTKAQNIYISINHHVILFLIE